MGLSFAPLITHDYLVLISYTSLNLLKTVVHLLTTYPSPSPLPKTRSPSHDHSYQKPWQPGVDQRPWPRVAYHVTIVSWLVIRLSKPLTEFDPAQRPFLLAGIFNQVT